MSTSILPQNTLARNGQTIQWLKKKIAEIEAEVSRRERDLEAARRNLKHHRQWLAELEAER